MVETSQGSADPVQGFQQIIRRNYGLSRAIRRPLKLVHEGAQHFLDAQSLLDDWRRRIMEVLGKNPGTSNGADDGDAPAAVVSGSPC